MCVYMCICAYYSCIVLVSFYDLCHSGFGPGQETNRQAELVIYMASKCSQSVKVHFISKQSLMPFDSDKINAVCQIDKSVCLLLRLPIVPAAGKLYFLKRSA